MRNRTVTSIAIVVALAFPMLFTQTAGAINPHNFNYHQVNIITHEPSPAQIIQRLRAFYAEVNLEVSFANHVKQAQAAQATVPTSSGGTQSSAQNGIPAAWWPTALCEEGGRNDPYAGYFGILEWQGFAGYPTAGAAPLSVQLAWEAKYIVPVLGGPPDAPGQCHSY